MSSLGSTPCLSSQTFPDLDQPSLTLLSKRNLKCLASRPRGGCGQIVYNVMFFKNAVSNIDIHRSYTARVFESNRVAAIRLKVRFQARPPILSISKLKGPHWRLPTTRSRIRLSELLLVGPWHGLSLGIPKAGTAQLFNGDFPTSAVFW